MPDQGHTALSFLLVLGLSTDGHHRGLGSAGLYPRGSSAGQKCCLPHDSRVVLGVPTDLSPGGLSARTVTRDLELGAGSPSLHF